MKQLLGNCKKSETEIEEEKEQDKGREGSERGGRGKEKMMRKR